MKVTESETGPANSLVEEGFAVTTVSCAKPSLPRTKSVMGMRLGGGKLKATENEILSANSLVEEDTTVTTIYTNQPHYYNYTYKSNT